VSIWRATSAMPYLMLSLLRLLLVAKPRGGSLPLGFVGDGLESGCLGGGDGLRCGGGGLLPPLPLLLLRVVLEVVVLRLRLRLLLVAWLRGDGFPLGGVPGGESRSERRRSERAASLERLHRVPAVLLPAVVGEDHTHEHSRHTGPIITADYCSPRHPTTCHPPSYHPSEP